MKDLTRTFGWDFPAFDVAPFGMMRRFNKEMERMFGNEPFVPPVEVERKGDKLMVRAEIPGMKKEDIKVELTAEGLIVEGERKQETKTEKDGYFRTERTYGHFYRCVPLPEGANTEKVEANYVNGVLEVAIPVVETKKTVKQIPVKTAA